MKATRAQVYKAIDSERDYQDAMTKVSGWNHTKRMGEYLPLLREYLRRAESAWVGESDEAGNQESVVFMRKIGGIAVACMEEFGAPLRTQ